MSKRVLMRVRGVPIYWDGTYVEYTAGMTIDGDGSPHCYHPLGSPPGLDFLRNAGHPGNWWALATTTRKPSGMPLIQTAADPAPGFFVSMTSYQRPQFKYADPNRYLNSEVTPFAVLPGPLLDLVKPIFMGCEVEMFNLDNGKMILGLCGDSGPAGHLGEASMAAARGLGIKSDPKGGGTESPIVHYRIRPGVAAILNGETFRLQPS